jgi:hypothetical protein
MIAVAIHFMVLVSTNSLGDIVKCVDQNGLVTYADETCPENSSAKSKHGVSTYLPSEWQQGVLVNSLNGADSAIEVDFGGILLAKNINTWIYNIRKANINYYFSHRHRDPLNVTVNNPIFFRINGDKGDIKDEAGKITTLTLIRKEAVR